MALTSPMFFSQAGNVGINTGQPQEKLHVKGKIRFEPTQTAFPANPGYSLVSDANGNATWQNIDLQKPSYIANYTTTPYNRTETFAAYPYTVSRSKFRASGTSLTLPKGKWLVIVSLGVYPEVKLYTESSFHALPDGRNVWTRASFFEDNVDNSDTNPSADIVTSAVYSSQSVIGPNTNGLITGEFFVNQTQNTPKTYYLKYRVDYFSPESSQFRLNNFGISPQIAPENFIMAYPLNF